MTIQLDGGVVPLTVGIRLELARRAAGYTQQQLADLMEVGVSTIKLLAWAMATGAHYQWLETGNAPTDDGEGGSVVRHQGLEPRTRWYGANAPDLHLSVAQVA
jgi:hypothetical protein